MAPKTPGENDSTIIDEALAEYFRRVDAGEDVDHEAFAAAHPEVADALRSYFAQEQEFAGIDIGNRTNTFASGATPVHQLQVRCPHCHAASLVAVDQPLIDLHCDSCGSTYSLTGDSKETHAASRITRMGHFELTQRIGVGGFGTVWKARDTQLDRAVAIKIPRRGQLSRDDVEKFFREARAAAQLRHPNIVRVHEIGRDGDTIYIVSELVRGVTIDDWLTAHQPTHREAVALCIKIADALRHAHAEGVIHRDIKPGNIMLDGKGEPYLMDFGLARRAAGEVTMTLDGQVLGTPAYMSPEQAQGDGRHADERSDLYSMGVILFQLITGELPFRGNRSMLIYQVINDEPPSPRKLNPLVSRDLETITLKCLEKKPNARYESAQALSEDLTRYLHNEPINARPIGTIARAARWCRRHRSISVLAASLLFVLCSAVAVSSYFAAEQAKLATQQHENFISSLTARLFESRIGRVEEIIGEMEPYADEAIPLLNHELETAVQNEDRDTEIRIRVALLEFENDSGQVEPLLRKLLLATPEEVTVVRRFLGPYRDKITAEIWPLLDDSEIVGQVKLRFGAILAGLDPKSELWQQHAQAVAESLVAQNDSTLDAWCAAIAPVGKHLILPLRAIYLERDDVDSDDRRVALNIILNHYATDDPEFLTELMLDSPRSFVHLVADRLTSHQSIAEPILLQELNPASDIGELGVEGNAAAKRKANAVGMLVRFGRLDPIRYWLERHSDPRVRSYAVHRLCKFVGPDALRRWIANEGSADILAVLLMAVGEFPLDDVNSSALADWKKIVANLHFQHPDPEVHSAADWLLRRWGAGTLADENLRKLATGKLEGYRRWYVTKTGQITMVVIELGSGSTIAMASKQTTEELFRKFAEEAGAHFDYHRSYNADPKAAKHLLSWFDAVAFCRWFSEQEGIEDEEMCFPPVDKIRAPMRLDAGFEARTGYRLPQNQEWVDASKAGTATAFYFGIPDHWGSDDELWDKYIWHLYNSDKTQVPGLLKPNQWGLFDMFGNVSDWAMERPDLLSRAEAGEEIKQKELLTVDAQPRIRRGFSSYDTPSLPWSTDSAMGEADGLRSRATAFGFRLVRTFKPVPGE